MPKDPQAKSKESAECVYTLLQKSDRLFGARGSMPACARTCERTPMARDTPKRTV